MGTILEIEASVSPADKGRGKLTVTGIVDEEEIGSNDGKKIKRKSMAKSSVENVLTVMKKHLDVNPWDFDIHLNFPGGVPVDGPSAGIAVAVAVYSAITDTPVDNSIAMTGELSIRGKVMPVGGIVAKVEAAKAAGAKKVIIPKENYQHILNNIGVEIIAVEDIREVIEIAIKNGRKRIKPFTAIPDVGLLAANGVKPIQNNANITSIQ